MWIALLAAVSCSPCHDAIVRSFAATGMARLGLVTRPEQGAGWLAAAFAGDARVLVRHRTLR